MSTLLVITAIGRVQHDARNLHKNPTEANKREYDASLAWFQALVGATGTIATIFGAFVLYRNFEVANRNAQIAAKNFNLAEDRLRQDAEKARKDEELAQSRLMTERFSKAVEQLGSDKIEVRLGGIYALERIAQDSDRDHWTIMEVLTAFIREKSPKVKVSQERTQLKALELEKQLGIKFDPMHPLRDELYSQAKRELYDKPIAIDIQAALTVIGRRKEKQRLLEEGKYLDLSNTNLREANLESAYLVGASFRDADLRDANFFEADLSDADLSKANLSGANLLCTDLSHADLSSTSFLIDDNLSGTSFSCVNLSGASLSGVSLREADLSHADLSHADLKSANLDGADLREANLNGADLREADLSYADLREADLDGANFSKANLSGANLSGASLCHVCLSDANLSDADLSDADLNGTDLNGANLREADLCGVKALTDHQLESAKLCQTKLPEGIKLNPDRNCGEVREDKQA